MDVNEVYKPIYHWDLTWLTKKVMALKQKNMRSLSASIEIQLAAAGVDVWISIVNGP